MMFSDSQRTSSLIKYGELFILGVDEDRTKSRFSLCQKRKPNGVKPTTVHKDCNPQAAKAISMKNQHSVSYSISKLSTTVVEYASDSNTDMFQIGRSTETAIDFVVKDTVPDSHSAISRFACRIVCQRSPPYAARIYAAGFDSAKTIFLGENAVKWTRDGQMDGLTTNGVLVMHPQPQGSEPGLWREVSISGNVFPLRKTTSSPPEQMDSESQELLDGSLIDLCGVTLIWRTAEGLERTPMEHLEVQRQEIYAGRPCFVPQRIQEDPREFPEIPVSHPPVLRTDLVKHVRELTLDPNTAHVKICLSKNTMMSTKYGNVTRVEGEQKYPAHADRFKDYGQVMCRESLTGPSYWEVEWSGRVEIAVTYRGISRKGDDSQFGYNDKSWSLRCSGGDNRYTAWHNNEKTDIPHVTPSSRGRVGVYVDHIAGTVSFYEVSPNALTHLHSFQTTFTEPLYAGFWVGWSDSSVNVRVKYGSCRIS